MVKSFRSEIRGYWNHRHCSSVDTLNWDFQLSNINSLITFQWLLEILPSRLIAKPKTSYIESFDLSYDNSFSKTAGAVIVWPFNFSNPSPPCG